MRRNGKSKTPFPRKRAILWVAAVILLAYVLGTDILEKQKGSLTIRRNFYGILRVFEEEKGTKEHRYSLYHGNVEHGNQYLNCPERPTTYYGYESSIGIAIREHPERSQGLRVGVVGLGAGVIAAYSRQVVASFSTRSIRRLRLLPVSISTILKNAKERLMLLLEMPVYHWKESC